MRGSYDKGAGYRNRAAAFGMAAFLIAGSVLPAFSCRAFAATAPVADGSAEAAAATAPAETAAATGTDTGTAANAGTAVETGAATAANVDTAAEGLSSSATDTAAADTAAANAGAAGQNAATSAEATTAASTAGTTAAETNTAGTNTTVSAPAAAAGTTVGTANADATVSTANAQTVPAIPAVPSIYAVKSVSGSVILKAAEAVDEAAVSEHLEENLKAAVDVATGTVLTTEEWEHAIATVVWEPAPVGYDSTKKEEYSFTWSGVIKAGTMVYADETKLKAAVVGADIPVVVTYNVAKAKASVSESKAPQTGDSFNPGLWVYFIVIGVVVALCSLILFRDTGKTK
ncbi:MAG: hypothetical protein J5966_08255 [Lachnospiraceae bacterium]|nr:hypothetical protein [Lachnospiraceae bacterium]